MATLALSGCYAGVVGLIVGIQALSEDSGSDPTNRPPAKPDFKGLERIDGDHVLVTYTLLDDDGGMLDVRAEYQAVSPEGEELVPYQPLTEFADPVTMPDGQAVRSDGLLGLALDPNAPGTFHFVWDARRDLGRPPLERMVARVRVRLAAIEAGSEGEAAVSSDFIAGNEPPEVMAIEPRATVAVIPLDVTLADSTLDPVKLQCRLRAGEGTDWKPMTLLNVGRDALFETKEAGNTVTLFWDSRADLGTTANLDVRIEVLPSDLEPGEPFERGPVTVDNNSEPQVQLLDLSRPEDKSFEIPIRFIARDEEGHPVSVILQWARGSEEFPEVPLPEILSGAEIESLASLLDADDPASVERRREIHILSEAPRLFRGVVDARGDLAANQVCLTDLVRAGLVFRPPTELAPRPLPPPPFGDDSGVFLIGQEIRFDRGEEGFGAWRRIAAFDPATSTATLDGPSEAAPGETYELRVRGGLARLAASAEGHLHTFVWDSARDMKESEADPASTLRIRAVGVDSEVGVETPQSILKLDSAPFAKGSPLVTDDLPVGVAVGDVNGDGRKDVAILHGLSGSVWIYFQGPLGEIPRTPGQILATEPSSYGVEIGDLNGDGREDLVAASCGGKVRVYYQGSDGKLPAEAQLQIPESGACLLLVGIGDVSSDGLNDLVVTWNSPPYGAEVFLQKQPPGSGLAATSEFKLEGEDTRPVTIGDLDGDGDNDVALAHQLADRVGVYFQEVDETSGGTFDPAPDLQLRFDGHPVGLTAGDLDADGRSDLAVTYWNAEGLGGVGIFFQEPGLPDYLRSLPVEPQWTLEVEGLPGTPRVADLNGDGRNDLAIANFAANNVSIYYQWTDGAQALPRAADLTLPVEDGPILVVADINGDGRDDILTVNYRSDTASVYFQENPGLLPASPIRTLEVEGTSHSVAVGDVNGDGREDIVAASFTSSSLNVFFGDRFGLAASVPDRVLGAGLHPRSVAIGDLHGDGRNDIAVANFSSNTLGIYRQNSAGALDPNPTVTLASRDRPHALAIGDLNGDGRSDLAVANRGSRVMSIHLQDSGNLPEAPILLETGERPHELCIGDLNGDGRRDLAVALRDANKVIVFLQDPSGNLSSDAAGMLDTRSSPIALAVGDLNADGRNDLAVAEFESDTISLYLQETSGSLPRAPGQSIPTGRGPLGVSIGRVNGDDREDLLVANFGSSTVSIYWQSPSGGFPEAASEVLRDFLLPGPVVLGDLNGDGRNDLVVPNREKPETGPYTLGVYLAR